MGLLGLSGLLGLAPLAACGDNAGAVEMPDAAAPLGNLFPDKPECSGDPVVAFAGTHPQIMNTLGIGTKEDGFDLDGDRDADCTAAQVAMGACHEPDNKLAAGSAPAQSSIDKALAGYSLGIPLELFDYDGSGADDCVKFALYLGAFAADGDGDGSRPGVEDGDCNDHDAAIKPGATEVVGDFKDNDCNGRADETGATASTDTLDRDADGVTLAAGDCDDTSAAVHPGALEVCGDGLDNDCDGTADRTGGATTTACNPLDPATPQDIPIDRASLEASGKPSVIFDDGTITEAGGMRTLHAGPSLFSITIPFSSSIGLTLRISGATIEATVNDAGGVVSLSHGRLGGVIDSKTADTIRGLDVPQFGLTPDGSLLDAAYANVLGVLLALPLANRQVLAKYPDCRTPDIDVDGDGLEAFCQVNATDEIYKVDLCIDGDGTEIADVKDSAGVVTMECSSAQVGGKDRFVDGISVELNFSTAPAKSLVPPAP